MTFALVYWVLMLVWAVFGLWSVWPDRKLVGGNILIFFLLLVIGWKVSGAPIHS